MEVLQTYQLQNRRTGRTVQIVAYHEPGHPAITMVVTCEGCGEEISRREFDASTDSAEMSAARAGWSDAILYGGHVCSEVAS